MLISFGLGEPIQAPPGTRNEPVHNVTRTGIREPDWVGIRSAHISWIHNFRQAEGGLVAYNPGQRWNTFFDGTGFVATPNDASWTWGLRLQSIGHGNNLQKPGHNPAISTDGQRLSYHWPCGVEEWFINDERGLEHGFNLEKRLPGFASGEPLAITLQTYGNLQTTVCRDTSGLVRFHNKEGATVVTYSGLKAWDADGKVLSARFEQGADGAFQLIVEEASARYPVTIDPVAQQAILKASNPGEDDQFGRAVAISGNTVVVGAPEEDGGATGVNGTPDENSPSAGAAYVFVRNSGSWSQQAYLKAINSGPGDRFGSAVSIDGDTIIIGAPWEGEGRSGAAYVFTRNGEAWSQRAFLKASNADGGDQFGCSVAISGATVAVGARGERSTTTGVNTTPNNLGINVGAAYVFRLTDGDWSQQAYLKPSNPFPGGEFGTSIATSNDLVVVGYPGDPSSTTGVNTVPNEGARFSGAAYVFEFDSELGWFKHSYLKAFNTQRSDQFGHSVAVSSNGQTVVVGAPGEDGGTTGVNSPVNEAASEAGAVYVFERSRSGWDWTQQAYLKASNTGAGDRFGHSVSITSPLVEAAVDTLVVGAYREDSSTAGVDSAPDEASQSAGAAYVFERQGTTWSHRAYLKASNPSADDYFGYAVGIDNGTVAVGAFGEDGAAGGVNTPSDDMAPEAGAAYIFTGFGPPDLEVQSPLRKELFDGASAIDFGVIEPGGVISREVILLNRGGEPLTGLTLELGGPGAVDFNLPVAQTSNLDPGASLSLSLSFNPTVLGVKTAHLSIVSNDPAENPFTITLNGAALSHQQDSDSDGLNDAAEFQMAALGFDWELAQPMLVDTYFRNANEAGLYTLAQIQAIQVEGPLLMRDPNDGVFSLKLGVNRSTSLVPGSFEPLPIEAGQVIVDEAGMLQLRIVPGDDAAFFRIEIK